MGTPIRVSRGPKDILLAAYDARNRIIGTLCIQPHTRTSYAVCGIEINGLRNRRKGIGTALYHTAFHIAAQVNKTVRSDTRRSPFSEAVWRRHVAQGYARSVVTGRLGRADMGVVMGTAKRMCNRVTAGAARAACVRDTHAKLLAALPVPLRTPRGQTHWPARYHESLLDVWRQQSHVRKTY